MVPRSPLLLTLKEELWELIWDINVVEGHLELSVGKTK